ncbi:MAG: hypothetical protein H7A45_03145 [Verrucomicrobiales bacterium]|nr:hypothetical protein [Verrucomicrobiales bacterium]MCP5527811.1 hypothetical protein [Verrucomicrobiales bacterium]
MGLVWHHLLKDLRQFRWPIALWWLFLGVDLALGLVAPGAVRWAPQQGFQGGAAGFAGWVVAALWFLAVGLPVAANFADAPGRENSWLRTRPFPGETRLAVKAAFAILVILLPALLQEGVRLAMLKVPGALVFRAVGERGLLLAPVVVAASAFGWLWATSRQMAIGLGVLGATPWVALLGLAVLSKTVPAFAGWIDDPTYGREVIGLSGLAVGFVLLVWLNRRGVWPIAGRLVGAGGLGLGAMLIAFVPDWDPFPIEPSAPFPGWSGEVRVEAPPASVSLIAQVPEGEAASRYGVQFTPEIANLPATLTLEWRLSRAKAVTSEGDFPLRRAWSRRDLFGYRSGTTAGDLRAFDVLLGGGVVFACEPPVGMWQANVTAGPVDASEVGARPFRLRAELAGNLFRWRIAARLRLRAGEAARDEAGRWEVMTGAMGGRAEDPSGEAMKGAFDRGPEDPYLYVGLRRDQLALQTASDASLRDLPYWPSRTCEFALYDRATQLAVVAPFPVINVMRLGGLSGYEHRFLILPFDLSSLLVRSWAKADPGSLELVIFQRDYVGSITAPMETGTIILPNAAAGAGVGNLVRSDQLTWPEFRRRIAALTAPAPDANRLEVGRYMAEVLQLTDARRHLAQAGDPLVANLARYVPEHAALFLEALPVAGNYAQALLRDALEQGLSEAQAELVVAALPAQRDLAGLIVRRGWLEAARGTFLDLAEAAGPLNYETIQALAWFDDPRVHGRLLDEFEHRPRLAVYELLCALPDLEPALEQRLGRVWDRRSRAVRPEHQVLPELAVLMRAGHSEALALALRTLKLAPPEQQARLWSLLDALRDGVLIEGLTPAESRQPENQVAWFSRHEPGDFAYDPVRRRFRLRDRMAHAVHE